MDLVDYSDLTDNELANRVRLGDNRAFSTLWARHERNVLLTARRFVTCQHDAEDVAQDVAIGLLSALKSGNGPQEDRIRSYLFTSVRHTAFRRLQRTTREVPMPDDDRALSIAGPADSEARRTIIVAALLSLPDRWRTVIEATVIHGFKPHELSPGVGLTGNSTSALALRAREGLRQAYLLVHAKPATEESCKKIIEKMPLYVRGHATARNIRRIEDHVAEHPECARRLEAMQEANELLPCNGSTSRRTKRQTRSAMGDALSARPAEAV